MMSLFGPSPSVGPTTVARVSPATRDVAYTTDNGGDPGALIGTVETIFEQIDRFANRFGGRLNGNGFDIGYFPNPEDGSGQTGGYNFKAIIGAHAEDEDRFTGLSEAELITEAVTFIVREGLEGIDVPEVAEAAKHSIADSLERLFDDLVFAERFGALRAALEEAGQGVDSYTVSLQRQRLQIAETGRTLATDGVTAIRGFVERVTTLFPGRPHAQPVAAGESSLVHVGSPGAQDRTRLLFEQDEGRTLFQPGVAGLFDDGGGGGLVGFDLSGARVGLTDTGYRDEGRLFAFEGPDPAADQVVMSQGQVAITTDALQNLAGAVAAAGDVATDSSQSILDNQERVRDAFAIAQADVDTLIARIAGAFEPATIGPFEERLIAGTAAIDQLEHELERINADIADATEVFPELGVAAIDVAAKITEASHALRAQLAADYRQEVSDELLEATGRGAQVETLELLDEYRDRRADGEAIGVSDLSDLDQLYRQRIADVLNGADDLAEIIDQLGASFTDVDDAGAILTGAQSHLRDRFEDDLAADLLQVGGPATLSEATGALDEYQSRRDVGVALGLSDFSGLDQLYRDRLVALLSGSDDLATVIDRLGASFADIEGVGALLAGVQKDLRATFEQQLAADVAAAQGVGLLTRVTEAIDRHDLRRADGMALGVDDLSGLDVVLEEQLSGLLAPAALTPDVIEALRTAFSDNVLVMDALTDAIDLTLGAANDNAAAQQTLADVTARATQELPTQIREQEQLARTVESVVESVAGTRRRLATASDLSIQSPADQLEEARRFFENLATRAAEGDQDAQLELGEAGEAYLRLARDFYASNEEYARIFERVDTVLADTESLAQQQLDVARAQLEELRSLSRALGGQDAGLPNPNADFGAHPTRNRMIARLTGYSGDFGNGAFGAFRAGLSADMKAAVDLIDNTVRFAEGGVMTASGPLPIHGHASGGIATTPHLALFGEGRMAEAFVPLPDGRSIPVTVTEVANDAPDGVGDGLAELILETRKVAAAVAGLRADNAALRRGLERVTAAARGAGRAA
jgi:hypothetical protein